MAFLCTLVAPAAARRPGGSLCTPGAPSAARWRSGPRQPLFCFPARPLDPLVPVDSCACSVQRATVKRELVLNFEQCNVKLGKEIQANKLVSPIRSSSRCRLVTLATAVAVEHCRREDPKSSRTCVVARVVVSRCMASSGRRRLL